MNFIDACTLPEYAEAPGLHFVSDCEGWRVVVDHRDDPREWFVWQRCEDWRALGGERGYVRRLTGLRFATRVQGQLAAAVLAALPFSPRIEQAALRVKGRLATAWKTARDRLRGGAS